jgi:anti-sigma B factor antagonist
MKQNSRSLGDICILEIEGEIDAEHSAQLKSAIAKARKDLRKHFILDFNRVSFIDSTGLGVLISLMRHLRENGGELRITGIVDEVRSIFEITRLFKVFELCATVEDAVQDILQKKK